MVDCVLFISWLRFELRVYSFFAVALFSLRRDWAFRVLVCSRQLLCLSRQKRKSVAPCLDRWFLERVLESILWNSVQLLSNPRLHSSEWPNKNCLLHPSHWLQSGTPYWSPHCMNISHLFFAALKNTQNGCWARKNMLKIEQHFDGRRSHKNCNFFFLHTFAQVDVQLTGGYCLCFITAAQRPEFFLLQPTKIQFREENWHFVNKKITFEWKKVKKRRKLMENSKTIYQIPVIHRRKRLSGVFVLVLSSSHVYEPIWHYLSNAESAFNASQSTGTTFQIKFLIAFVFFFFFALRLFQILLNKNTEKFVLIITINLEFRQKS